MIAVFIAVMAQGVLGITIALGSVPLLGFGMNLSTMLAKPSAPCSIIVAHHTNVVAVLI